jgi:hypothetical protein
MAPMMMVAPTDKAVTPKFAAGKRWGTTNPLGWSNKNKSKHKHQNKNKNKN